MSGAARRARLSVGLVLLALVLAAWWLLDASVDCSQFAPYDSCDGDEVRGAALFGMYVGLIGLPAAGQLILSGLEQSWPNRRWNRVLWVVVFLTLVAAGIVLGAAALVTAGWGVATGGLLGPWGVFAAFSGVVAFAFARESVQIVRDVLAPAMRERAAAVRARQAARPAAVSEVIQQAGPSISLRHPAAPWGLVALSLLGLIAAVPLGFAAIVYAFGVGTIALLTANLHRFSGERAATRLLTAAVVLLTTSFALLAVAVVAAGSADCPAGASNSVTFSDATSQWPPGVRCLSGAGERYVHQPHPWLTWTVGLVAVGGYCSLFLASLGYGRRDATRD